MFKKALFDVLVCISNFFSCNFKKKPKEVLTDNESSFLQTTIDEGFHHLFGYILTKEDIIMPFTHRYEPYIPAEKGEENKKDSLMIKLLMSFGKETVSVFFFIDKEEVEINYKDRADYVSKFNVQTLNSSLRKLGFIARMKSFR